MASNDHSEASSSYLPQVQRIISEMDATLNAAAALGSGGMKRAGTPLRLHRASFLNSHEYDEQDHGHNSSG